MEIGARVLDWSATSSNVRLTKHDPSWPKGGVRTSPVVGAGSPGRRRASAMAGHRCDTASMNESPEVSAWLDRLEHPKKDVILAVRAVILGADERMTETIKWQSPTFMYQGNLASIDPKSKKHVSVLFHRGAEIPGHHPLLVGEGKLARYARFADLEAVQQARDGLTAIVRAWCDSRA